MGLTGSLTAEAIAQAAQAAGIADRPIDVHAALSSFGHVEGGSQAVVDGLLLAGCTVIVPSFSTSAHLLSPDVVPAELRPPRNAEAASREQAQTGLGRVFDQDSAELNASEGMIAAVVTAMDGRVRGNHPLNSFSAVGPLAQELIELQTDSDLYAPLRAAADYDGFVVLMGVGLDKMTLLHAAEEDAGRAPFVQWARVDGEPTAVRVGSCSGGLEQMAPVLAPFERRVTVGESLWRIFPIKETLTTAAAAMRRDPDITRCAPSCERCTDNIAGGPITDDTFGS